MELRKFIATTIREYLSKQILKENLSISDYSGEYEDLYNFINDNDLQEAFITKYNEFVPGLTIKNWEEFVYGEIDTDEEVIKELIGNGYKVYYDEYNDVFIVTKKKEGKLKYDITESGSNEIIKILEDSGVYSEYEPRFAVKSNNKIIGGSTYYIDEDNFYNFDIGVLDEYQGYGISKKLIDRLIFDAKNLKCDGMKAQVVNNFLFDYLIKIGFKSSIDSGIKYIYTEF